MSVDWPQPLSLPPQNIKLVDCDTFTQQRGATPDLVTTNVRPRLTQYLLASNPYMLHTTHTTRPRSLETPQQWICWAGDQPGTCRCGGGWGEVEGEVCWYLRGHSLDVRHSARRELSKEMYRYECEVRARCCDAHHLFITRAVLNKQVMFLQVVIPSAWNVTFSLSLI